MRILSELCVLAKDIAVVEKMIQEKKALNINLGNKRIKSGEFMFMDIEVDSLSDVYDLGRLVNQFKK